MDGDKTKRDCRREKEKAVGKTCLYHLIYNWDWTRSMRKPEDCLPSPLACSLRGKGKYIEEIMV